MNPKNTNNIIFINIDNNRTVEIQTMFCGNTSVKIQRGAKLELSSELNDQEIKEIHIETGGTLIFHYQGNKYTIINSSEKTLIYSKQELLELNEPKSPESESDDEIPGDQINDQNLLDTLYVGTNSQVDVQLSGANSTLSMSSDSSSENSIDTHTCDDNSDSEL